MDSITYKGTVYPWQCDHIGHMNIMWYVSKFDEANWNFFATLGLTPAIESILPSAASAAGAYHEGR